MRKKERERERRRDRETDRQRQRKRQTVRQTDKKRGTQGKRRYQNTTNNLIFFIMKF